MNTVTIFLDENVVNVEGDSLVQGIIYAVAIWWTVECSRLTLFIQPFRMFFAYVSPTSRVYRSDALAFTQCAVCGFVRAIRNEDCQVNEMLFICRLILNQHRHSYRHQHVKKIVSRGSR